LKKILFILISIVTYTYSQNIKVDYENPIECTIKSINVIGVDFLDKKTLISISGLGIGEKINIPGKEISKAIKNLWKQDLFSDVKISIGKIEEDEVSLNIILQENRKLSKFKFNGDIKKSEISSIKEELKLMRGNLLSNNLVINSVENIKSFFKNKGYHNVEVNYSIKDDPTTVNASDLVFDINKGNKIKIKEIIFHGRLIRENENKNLINKKDQTFAISNFSINRSMKNTKTKKWWRIFKTSKFSSQNLASDLMSVINKYQEKGFRDARIIKDSISYNSDNTLNIHVWIFEGEKYKFRNIEFVGNTKYTNQELQQVLSIKKGDLYNKSILDSRIYGDPNGTDISSLYLDDGYLFFNANPLETATKNNEIDLEVRIYEGKQAKINKVKVVGNTKTNDHVIMREIRTKPGDLFRRSDIIRTQRELAALDYFNPETLGNIDINPDPVRNTVDITYNVEEKSSDRINLSGGWGAGRIIGQLSLSFNNFSSKEILNTKSWTPLPSGDGQRLTLSASSNGVYYQNYSLQFLEPWLGGKKPTSLSVSLYKNVFSNALTGDQRESTELTGVTIGIGKRLKFPDDYFTIRNSVNFQQYKLTNSQSFFSFTDGVSNNINFNITIGRDAVDQPIYPRRGSKFEISLSMTPPYSLFDGIDDYTGISDQEKYKFMEFYKWQYKSVWYSAFSEKLVLATRLETGLLGAYNQKLGSAPFERFYLGGDGLSGMGYQFDGRELISLRGYSNNSVSPQTGGTIYNRYTAEIRYAISLNPASTVYALGFLEAGNAWDNFELFNPFSVKRSVGLGVRITIPMMGLMGLDYGWGLDNIPGNPDANGGQFHFSIGQNF
tara:strand:- start:130 stop:2640 length:2511 start_codon:yes stop_codon:yes gene_type:complete